MLENTAQTIRNIPDTNESRVKPFGMSMDTPAAANSNVHTICHPGKTSSLASSYAKPNTITKTAPVYFFMVIHQIVS